MTILVRNTRPSCQSRSSNGRPAPPGRRMTALRFRSGMLCVGESFGLSRRVKEIVAQRRFVVHRAAGGLAVHHRHDADVGPGPESLRPARASA